MTFTVVWTPAAQRELEQIWQTANDRDTVLRRVWDIEGTLTRGPREAGESRPDNRFVAYALPLGVLYEVVPNDAKVFIASAWWVRRR
jgi:hypothetical protein